MAETQDRQRDDTLARGYEKMLSHAHGEMKRSGQGASLGEGGFLRRARDRMVELGELTREEAQRVGEYLERDIEDAARFIAETGDDIKAWWRFDVALMEERLMEAFAHVADQTSLQLANLAEEARQASRYHTDEIAGPGTLVCEQCGKEIELTRAERIPACPACGATAFTRVTSASSEGEH